MLRRMPSIQTSVAKPPSPTTWRKSPGLSRIHFKTSACRKRVETDAQASRELTAVQTDFLQYIFQAINNLLTQNLGFFDTMGQNLFRSFATILVAWFGIKSALASASGRPSFQFDHFASLLLTISFGFAMVNYYSTPIPGVGVSFHNLVTDEAQFLSSQIDQAQLQTVVTQVGNFEARMDSPSWGDFLGTSIYVIVTILLAAAQAISIGVLAYGFIPTAVCGVYGPVL